MNVYSFEMEALRRKDVFLDGISWDEKGLQIRFLDSFPLEAKKKVTVIFPNDVLSFRCVFEYQGWKIAEQIEEWKKHMPPGTYHYPMLVSTASDYIEWYKTQETIDNLNRLPNLKHFFFLTDDFSIDVIEDREPIVVEEDYVYLEGTFSGLSF